MARVHLVAHTPDAWGHVKPLLAFFQRLGVRQSPDSLIMSLLTCAPMLPRVKTELERMPVDMALRINVIDIGAAAGPGEPVPSFALAFEMMWAGDAVECRTTRQKFYMPRPTVSLIDPFCIYALDAVKSVSGGTCPVIVWIATPMHAFLRFAGPTELGGFGDIGAAMEAAALNEGRTIAEVASRMSGPVGADVVRLPGLPDMCHYEYHPQELAAGAAVSSALVIKDCHRFVLAADGVVVVATSAFERGSIDAGRAWLAHHRKDLWAVGPLEDVLPAMTAPVHDMEGSHDQGHSVSAFLDQMEQTHGAHSVIFIAFGTTYYPRDPCKVHAFIEELLATGTPFLWAHASPHAHVPPELAATISASGWALHVDWVLQRDVLRHAAIGWFVSHGGWNSVQEALCLGVPMILWPMTADQPGNAALLSTEYGAAFELLSVRTGTGARQPLRLREAPPVDFSVQAVRRETRELLGKLGGEEGMRVRERARRLAVEMNESWEGGEAARELEGFIRAGMAVV